MQWNPSIPAPLGPTHSECLDLRVVLISGVFTIRKIRLGQHAVSALPWMSLVQECPQGGVPLYVHLGLQVRIICSQIEDYEHHGQEL